MNQTGTWSWGSPRQARRNGESTLTIAARLVTPWLDATMRRSIDDHPFDPALDPVVADDPDLTPVSWAIAISDDYDDAGPRVILTVDEMGRAGEGLVAHLLPAEARRLRIAIRDALREVGEDPGP
jgi:hypothetical protein